MQVYKVAASENKLLSGKVQKVFQEIGNDESTSNPWQEQRKKSVIKPEEKVQLILFNRFSHWEEDESEVEIENEDESDVKSDELNCFTQTVGGKKQEKDVQIKKIRNIIKRDDKHIESFETYNKFSDLQCLTEDDVENISNVQNPIKIEGRKMKCNSCNFKTRCSSNPAMCKANRKLCKKCLKTNHFPKSKNCSKTRTDKFNAKMNEKNQKDSCQTLRYFLKSKNYHLKHGKIPYDDLKLTVKKEKGARSKLKTDQIFNMREITVCLKLLEEKIDLKNRVSNLCYGSNTFLLFYLFMNMDSFLLENAFNLQEDYSNEDVLIMQNLVNLIKDNKQDPAEIIKEEMLMKKLQKKMHTSEKLVMKYTHKLKGIIGTKKSVDKLKVHDPDLEEHSFPQLDGMIDIPLLSSDKEETTMDSIPSLSPFSQFDGHQDLEEESFHGLAAFDCQSELMSTVINIFRSHFW